MNILRKILLAFGILMLISIVVGFLRSETKYFYLSPGEPKTEITKSNYEMYFDKSRKWASDYTKFTSKEKVFNIQFSIISGVTVFSILIIVISLWNKNSIKTE
jgi:hypothetical protein